MLFCTASFRAALAFAMLSLRVFDDFETFRDSTSDCCSGVRSGAVDVADDFLDSAEVGERIVDEGLDGAFRVFFTWSVCDEGPTFDSAVFMGGLIDSRRELDGPGLFAPPYMLVLVEGCFSLEGLSTAARES